MSADRRIDDADIARAQAISISDIAIERGLVLKRTGREMIGPCPRCDGNDRFAINITKNLFNCRGCSGKGHGAISLVQFLDDVGFRDAVETLIGQRPTKKVVIQPLSATTAKADEPQRIESARRIWRASRDPHLTLAEKYLNGRRLDLPHDLRGRALRFHPSCPWGDGRVPALIAAFQPISEPDDDALPVAVLRVGLTVHGEKIEKRMLGPVAGCAIKLDADEAVSHGLGIAEGLETALAIRATGWRPVWCLGNAGAIERFPPLAGVEALTIFADNDESGRGIEAARKCAARWADAGCEVFIRAPREVGADWLDAQP